MAAKKSQRREKKSARREPSREDVAQSAREGNVGAGVPPTRQGSVFSATGQAVARELGAEQPPEDRGAPDAPEAEPDFMEGAEPKGLQAEPARFVSNGSLEPNMVASPSGPIPASSVTATREDAEQRVEDHLAEHDRFVQQRSSQAKRLSQATIDRVGGAELRAIARQRGYDIVEGGNRTTRRAFAAAQNDDETLQGKDVEEI